MQRPSLPPYPVFARLLVVNQLQGLSFRSLSAGLKSRPGQKLFYLHVILSCVLNFSNSLSFAKMSLVMLKTRRRVTDTLEFVLQQ